MVKRSVYRYVEDIYQRVWQSEKQGERGVKIAHGNQKKMETGLVTLREFLTVSGEDELYLRRKERQ